MGLDSQDYKMAVFSQEACNLSGIVHQFSRVINKIWKEAHEKGKGTDWVNNHEICRLYAEQIAHLTRKRGWDEAIKTCEERAAGEDALRLAGSQAVRDHRPDGGGL